MKVSILSLAMTLIPFVAGCPGNEDEPIVDAGSPTAKPGGATGNAGGAGGANGTAGSGGAAAAGGAGGAAAAGGAGGGAYGAGGTGGSATPDALVSDAKSGAIWDPARDKLFIAGQSGGLFNSGFCERFQYEVASKLLTATNCSTNAPAPATKSRTLNAADAAKIDAAMAKLVIGQYNRCEDGNAAYLEIEALNGSKTRHHDECQRTGPYVRGLSDLLTTLRNLP